ncbi:MAG: formate dehydrogenase accessory sulfurtransferase FdhD [marine benthic group bacterium]|nr:formate dehydrogenase accessory sulfurtransferase FdhD [Gemmatimonadota bacterium]MCL7968878.1 formate dehydrogenase accessory sulfurtransferase FdhD [Gemmatimonadota bacterium]
MQPEAAPAPPESVVALEFPDGTVLARWLCTPQRVPDLALGWLYSEGLIDDPDEVIRFEGISPVRQCIRARDEEPIRRALSSRIWEVGPARPLSIPAVHGRPAAPRSSGAEASMPTRDPAVKALLAEPSHLKELFNEMFERTHLKEAHGGGLHTGGHVIDGTLLDIVEDVSRSAVVDKLIGAALLEDSLGPSSLLLLSGRISATIAAKLARAGVGAAATISVPTSLAVEIADRYGVAIVGRARRETPHRYGVR